MAARLGFIGLGNMGCSMAANLARGKQANLTVFDINPAHIDILRGKLVGTDCTVDVAETPADVAKACQTVITMLPSSPHVSATFRDGNGLLSTASKGSIFLDSSTIDPIVAKEVARVTAEAGSTYMDAPVSGGVTAAAAGTLTFMVGNEGEADFAAAKDVLQHMGANIFSLSGVGNGQAAKICNNMMLGVQMISTAEAYNLARKLGLSPKEFASIVNVSSGRCWSSDTYNPVPGIKEGVPSGNDWNGGFGAALMLKDLGLAQDAASAVKAETPMGSLAQQYYRMLDNHGYGGKDFGVAYKFMSSDDTKKISE